MIIVAAFSVSATAQTTHYWNGNGDGTSWNDSGNWSTGSVPSNGDNVVFDDGSTVALSSISSDPSNFTVQNATDITLGSNVTVTNTLTVASGSLDLGTSTVVIYNGISVSGGLLDFGSSTGHLVAGTLSMSSGTIDAGSGKISLYASMDIDGGTFNEQTSTLAFPNGDAPHKIASESNLSLYNIELNAVSSGFPSNDYEILTLEGSGSNTFTINGTLTVIEYDAARQPVVVTNATLSYSSGGTLDYNRSAGIPSTGDEWPSAGVPNVILSTGAVSLSSTGTITNQLKRENGSISGTVSYNSGASLVYAPTSSSNVSIGDEWPSSNGPDNVTINHSGYSVTGSFNRTIANTLELTSGTLDLGSNTMTVLGSVVGSDVAGSGSVDDATTLAIGNGSGSTESQTISGQITLNSLTIDKSGGATDADNTLILTGQLTLTNSGSITLANGIFDMNGKDIDVSAGGVSLTAQSGTTIKTGGTSLANYGSYTLSSATVIFDGSTSSESLPGDITIGTVVVNNSSGVDASSGTLSVSSGITLSSGLVTTTSTNSLRILSSATISGYSGSSYIAGPLQVEFSAADSVLFPVGTASQYRPAGFEYTSLTQNGGNSVVEITYSTDAFSTGSTPSGISSIDESGHYIVEEVGTAPSSLEYSFTGMYNAGNFTPESRNRVLVQSGSGPNWTTPENFQVFTNANYAQGSGFTFLPTNDQFVAFGAGGTAVVFNNNAGDNNWFTDSNWSNGSLPSSADSVVIDLDEKVEIGGGYSMQQVKALVLLGNATLTITSANENATALLVGDGEGSHIALEIKNGASLIVEGGTNRSVALDNGNETLRNNGTINLKAGTGLGTGSGGEQLPVSRQNHTTSSDFHFEIHRSNFLAQDYGNLLLNPSGTSDGSELTINDSLHVFGNYSQTGGYVTFVTGTSDKMVMDVDSSFTLSGNANFKVSDGASGANNFNIGKDMVVGSNATFTIGPNINFNLDGSGDQIISSAITAIDSLNVSGGSTKTINANLTIDAKLNLEDGHINTNGYTLTVGTGTSQTGSVAYTSGTVIGSMRRWVNSGTGSGVIFPVGNSDGETVVNREASLDFSANPPETGGTVEIEFVEGDPGTDGLPLDDNGFTLKNIGTTGIWRITAADGMENENFTYDVALAAANFVDVEDPNTLHLVKRETSSDPWEALGAHESSYVDGEGRPVIRRTGLSGFSEFTAAGGSDNALPVTFAGMEIEANRSERTPTLNWTTETEQNNYGFYIDRAYLGVHRKANSNKKVGQDTTWDNVAFVKGQGTTTRQQHYSYRDENLQKAGLYTYRLRQVDYDGQQEILEVMEFNFDKPESMKLLSNYPNPFNPTTQIPYKLSKKTHVHLAVYNYTGQRVATLVNREQAAGQYQVTFNASQLSSGMYIIHMKANGQSFTRTTTLVK